MSHLDTEIKILKADTIEMWKLVALQLGKTYDALTTFDRDLAREVISGEKRVNAFELKIDRDCENMFALFQPVAIDLRFVLATLKINSNLERIGDIAESISRFVLDVEEDFNKELLTITRITTMFQTANAMVNDTLRAFELEDTRLARTAFKMDETLDQINNSASHVISDCIQKYPDQIRHALHVLSMIRKLERVGDQTKNMAEEIIFMVEAKVLKHGTKKE
ncbi:MAG: phosphate signaling complex protein PhoU [Bacteroidia bacterium]|nr:phosphate signaling complex protein PhoU [Bacteroidia bacterium]